MPSFASNFQPSQPWFCRRSALIALGVLGRADLTSLGVDVCASLSFAFHDFACGLGWHMYRK